VPLNQFNKLRGGNYLADTSSENTGELLRSGIFTIDERGNINKNNPCGVFLLNPSSWEESKSANWVPQNIPGQSDQILQWISSGPRQVNFDALVTADTSDFASDVKFGKPGADSNPINKALSVVGKIASSFFNVSVPAPRASLVTKDNKGDKLDISNYLNYYRSLLYPVYDDKLLPVPKRLRNSPPLCVLFAGNSLSNSPKGDRVSRNSELWVVTNLRIRITKQLPNLSPMEAVVSFQLTQYTIRSFDRRRISDNL